MPSVIDEHLIDNATPLPPGATVRSNVTRTIYFGPTTNNAFAPFRTDDFSQDDNLSTYVPVCGPKLFVIMENRGGQNWTVDGTVYAIRVVP